MTSAELGHAYNSMTPVEGYPLENEVYEHKMTRSGSLGARNKYIFLPVAPSMRYTYWDE